MPKYKVRNADTYGHAVGILLLDYRGPFIPGDVGNATTYDYPVIFKLVKGLTLSRVLAGDPECEAAIVEAAKELEAYGVRGISSDCGFLVQYQDAVAKAVKVPVVMSSLLQIPFLSQMFAKGRPIGCITATRKKLGNRVLELAGVKSDINVVVGGMEEQPHFKEAILEEGGELDSDLVEAETVACARELMQRAPDMGAIVIECSMLPPYAAAVQKETNVPVFDFVTMIDYVYRGTHRTPYHGYY
ncbi:MAG: aspartate/glutamate racemase family protein [Hyphomicrobiales bacterium]